MKSNYKSGTKPVISVFPRVFSGVKTAAEQAEFLKKCGFTHGDLLIRKGFVVSEDTPEDDFEPVFEEFKKRGVTLYSAITDLKSASPEIEKILKVCNKHNLRKIKIGPYSYKENFSETVKEARKSLESLESLVPLSKKYDVMILVQNHGGTINSSPSLSRELVDGLPLENVGIYFDAGNMMRMDGHEAWAMGLDIIGDYLEFVGIKNVHWFKKDGKWDRDFCPLRDGIIDFSEVLNALKKVGYHGDFAVHSFYVPDGSVHDEKTIEAVTDDLKYFKELLEKCL